MGDRIIFPAPPSSYKDDGHILKIPVAGGASISAVYVPNPSSTFTLLHSHGNYEDIGDLQPYFEEMRQRGFAVLSYDYRGYGTSGGIATETHAYEDELAAYTYLVDRIGVPPSRIVVHGRSVGAALAIDLAARERVGGLIIESAFVTAFRVRTVIPLAPFDKFRNIDKIKRIRCPFLVIHGEADDIIPIWHGKKLFEAAPEPKSMLSVPGAGHNDLLFRAGNRYWDALVAFAASLPGAQTTPENDGMHD